MLAAAVGPVEVIHRERVPVIMLGHGSSGTSILATLLRDHLHIAFGTESQFIVRYYQRLEQYGDLTVEENLRKLVLHLVQERWFTRCRKWGFATTPAAILADVQHRTYRGVLDAVFGQLAKHFGYPRWGDKTPEYVKHLNVLGDLFPDAKYIHLMRDGRDVAISVIGQYWGPKNIYTAAHEWKRHISAIDAFAARLRAAQLLKITYEEMLSEPVGTFARIVGFLNIDDSSGALMEHLEQKLPAELKRDNYDRWKRQWSAKQCLAYERIACDVLRRHGYETHVERPSMSDNLLSKAYWMTDNKVRKWTFSEYWRDNIFKARLRTRTAFQSARSARWNCAGDPRRRRGKCVPD
jgi:hypothetical protein